MDALKRIELALKEWETEQKEIGRGRFWDTEVGIYGPTYVDLIFRFMRQIHIGQKAKFLDLGSGDGRVVLVASLFCEATGIEFNEELVEDSIGIAKEANIECNFIQGDFLNFDISSYNILFSNPDQEFGKGMEDMLIKKMSKDQVLWVHNDIFRPIKLKRGRTIWIDQMPITEYRNINEENQKNNS